MMIHNVSYTGPDRRHGERRHEVHHHTIIRYEEKRPIQTQLKQASEPQQRTNIRYEIKLPVRTRSLSGTMWDLL